MHINMVSDLKESQKKPNRKSMLYAHYYVGCTVVSFKPFPLRDRVNRKRLTLYIELRYSVIYIARQNKENRKDENQSNTTASCEQV